MATFQISKKFLTVMYDTKEPEDAHMKLHA
jgi:hypothetical protein